VKKRKALKARRRRARVKVRRIRRVVRRAQLVGSRRPRRGLHKKAINMANPRIRVLAQAVVQHAKLSPARALALAKRAFSEHERSGRASSSYRFRKLCFTIKGAPARARNPVPASSVERRVQQAGRLYERFSGHTPEVVGRVARPERSDVLVAIGRVDGIMYSTVRDGKLQRFIHEFAKSARPLFAVSHDGKQLEMLGGAYDFTARGIVDRTGRRGRA
jgi:hypothetical protein